MGVYLDGGSWVVRFRRAFAVTGRDRRKVRVPVTVAAPDDTGRGEAESILRDIERLRDKIEARRATPDDLSRAVEMRLLTRDESTAIARRLPPPLPDRIRRLTILDAALSHPATVRESDASTREFNRHRRELIEFCEWAGVSDLAALRLEHVVSYIAHMKREGRSKDGRRHRLMWIRRAARMGAARGIPDVLGDMVLDRSDGPRRRRKVWSRDQITAALQQLCNSDDRRPAACLILSGMMGLRSSEIIRLRVGDAGGGVLMVGEIESKNDPSRRALPIGPAVSGVLAPLLSRDPSHPLIAPATGHGRPKDSHFAASTYGRWMGDRLRNVQFPDIRPTDLRKSFLTWAHDDGLPPALIEQWMGHRVTSMSAVSADHYFASPTLDRLRPISTAIDRHVATAIGAT